MQKKRYIINLMAGDPILFFVKCTCTFWIFFLIIFEGIKVFKIITFHDKISITGEAPR